MRNSVLIFEESAVIRQLCVDVLEASGFTVDTVDDTVSAVSAVILIDYSFIIVGDSNIGEPLAMPASIRAAEQACGKYTPMIALGERSDRKSCFAAGMDDYVQMPLSINALRKTVDRWFHYSLGRMHISGVA